MHFVSGTYVGEVKNNWREIDRLQHRRTGDDSPKTALSYIRIVLTFLRTRYPIRFLVHVLYRSNGEHVLSFLCLVGGWSFIFVKPGVAILRCFRVFRMLW